MIVITVTFPGNDLERREKENTMSNKFLHNHPKLEEVLNIHNGHVIVDKKDWQTARNLLIKKNRWDNHPSNSM